MTHHQEALPPETLQAFRAWVARWLGLRMEEERAAQWATLLQRRAHACHQPSVQAYLTALIARGLPEEPAVLIKELTVGETFFFRHAEHFRVLTDVIVPRWRARQEPRGPLRILSAACSTGEEAYSIAMVLTGAGLPAAEFSIDAVDVNPHALDIARAGHYSTWSLRETPPAMRQRWFHEDGGMLAVDERLLHMVRWRKGNLAEDDPTLWRHGHFDAIFCRNALMYLERDAMAAAVERLVRSLVPGGHLFLGYAETLRGLSTACHLRHTHGTFYYQRKDAATGLQAVPRTDRPPALAPAWAVETGQSGLSGSTPGAAGVPLTDPPSASDRDLIAACELFRQERFDEASSLLARTPPGTTEQALAQRLQAMLLVHAGRFDAAQQLCETQLARDELDADAHHVLALCREAQGDGEGTVDHEQTAAYLDPAFAMPHLHLGMLARKQGQRGAARRELALAAHLIGREDGVRIDLFGGGFSRAALTALCEAELAACKEA